MKHGELIERMAREAAPVRPARGATLAVLWSIAAAGTVLALNAALFSARPDFRAALTTPRFLFAFASLLGILLAIAHRAASSALPGRGPAAWTRWLLVFSALALFGTLLMPLFTDPTARDWAAGMDPA